MNKLLLLALITYSVSTFARAQQITELMAYQAIIAEAEKQGWDRRVELECLADPTIDSRMRRVRVDGKAELAKAKQAAAKKPAPDRRTAEASLTRLDQLYRELNELSHVCEEASRRKFDAFIRDLNRK